MLSWMQTYATMSADEARNAAHVEALTAICTRAFAPAGDMPELRDWRSPANLAEAASEAAYHILATHLSLAHGGIGEEGHEWLADTCVDVALEALTYFREDPLGLMHTEYEARERQIWVDLAEPIRLYVGDTMR